MLRTLPAIPPPLMLLTSHLRRLLNSHSISAVRLQFMVDDGCLYHFGMVLFSSRHLGYHSVSPTSLWGRYRLFFCFSVSQNMSKVPFVSVTWATSLRHDVINHFKAPCTSRLVHIKGQSPSCILALLTLVGLQMASCTMPLTSNKLDIATEFVFAATNKSTRANMFKTIRCLHFLC